MMAQPHKSLQDILIEEGLLSREDLDGALKKSGTRNLSLEETLFKLGYLSRDTLGKLLARQYECEFIDLYSCSIDDDALNTIPPDRALELEALPYGFDEDTLLVALAGPFEARPLAEIVIKLEQVSGKKVCVRLCNPGPLKEMLARYCQPQAAGPKPGDSDQGELPFAAPSRTPSRLAGNLRRRFEELFTVGQNALIAARSHPFSNTVESIIDDARSRLAESKKHANSGFEEEAVDMAERAVALLEDAGARADSFAGDWESLQQRAKKLLSRISSLEQKETEETTSPEFLKLLQIRDALTTCMRERNVERLHSLLDRGSAITEKISLQEPGVDKSPEQIITTLAKVRDVVARAQDAGAEEYATDMLKEARALLDEADDCARHGQWDDVNKCLISAESTALEAEHVAIQSTKERERQIIKLRESTRVAISAFDKALAHPLAQEYMEEILQARDAISECKRYFRGGEPGPGIELANKTTARLKDEIIPLADRAEYEWNKLFRRAGEVSAQIESVDIPVAVRMVPEKLTLLLKNERKMIVSLCDRNREKTDEAISRCEGLVQEIGEATAAGKDSLWQAESAIANATSTLTAAAAYVVDKNTSTLHAQARQAIEKARSALGSGDADAALRFAQSARIKLEAEIIEPQESIRQGWKELSQKSKNVSEQIQAIDKLAAMKIAFEKMALLFQHEHDMVCSLAERNREQLADTLFACEELVREIRESIADSEEISQEAKTALREVKQTLAGAVRSGIDDYAASAYEETIWLLEGAEALFAKGDYAEALEAAGAALAKVVIDVMQRQKAVRDEWRTLIPRSSALIEQINKTGSTDAMYYCSGLVKKLHSGASGIFSALAVRDMEKAKAAIADVEATIESVEGAIEDAKSEHLRNLYEQFTEIEDAVQKAVQSCAGNYSADILENVYLDLNQIKEQLSKGPEALDAEREEKLKSDLAVARAKVWQVEFIRERFEREREETLRHLKLKMDAARENVEACVKLDFAAESAPLLERARALLEQVDSLLIEGDVEESFSVIRQCDTLTEEILEAAEKKEHQWKELAESLTAAGATYRKTLSDPMAGTFAAGEYAKLATLAKKTQSIIDNKDLAALQQHAAELALQTGEVAEHMSEAKKKERARIERKIQDAKREIQLAAMFDAKDVCPEIFDAACGYADIAERYLENEGFERADAMADDALKKSHESCNLAREVSERTNRLTLDYLRIALANIEQGDLDAAREAIEHGLDVADPTRTPETETDAGDSEA